MLTGKQTRCQTYTFKCWHEEDGVMKDAFKEYIQP